MSGGGGASVDTNGFTSGINGANTTVSIGSAVGGPFTFTGSTRGGAGGVKIYGVSSSQIVMPVPTGYIGSQGETSYTNFGFGPGAAGEMKSFNTLALSSQTIFYTVAGNASRTSLNYQASNAASGFITIEIYSQNNQ
jgi:hypothetical protein